MDPIVELLQALASPKLWRQVLAQSLPPATTGGLASPHEVSEKRHFLRRGRPAAARPRLRFPSGYRVSRERDRFRRSRRKTPLHPAGGLVRPVEPAPDWIRGGAVDHPDRPSAGRSWGELVRTPLLDRVGVQSLPPATAGGRSRAWVGNGKRPACRDRRAPWIVNTASPGGWPASSWGAQGVPRDWPHVRLTLSPSGWRGRERAGPALGGCLGGLISGPASALVPPLEALSTTTTLCKKGL